jgi:hypothetical protein
MSLLRKLLPKAWQDELRDITLIVLITLAIFFISGEILTRLFRKEPVPIFVASENQRLVYELNKDYPEINSFGMRDEDLDIDSIRDVYKIAVIGDSHAYSANVKTTTETFPSQLEQFLNLHAGQRIVKVLNFGVPGYNTAQELEALKTRALMFEPRIVILQYCINDTHICNYIQPKYKKLNWLIHKSQFLVVLWKNILYSHLGKALLLDWMGRKFPDALLFQEGLVGTLKGTDTEVPAHRFHPARTRDRVPERYHYMLDEDNWRIHIHSFARLCKQQGILLLATGFIEDKEKELFLKEGFDVYSFYDIFKDKDMREYGYNPDDTRSHFNAQGCFMVGRALAEYVRKHYTIGKDQ